MCFKLKIEQSFQINCPLNVIWYWNDELKIEKIPSPQFHQHDNLLGVLIETPWVKDPNIREQDSDKIKGLKHGKSLKTEGSFFEQWKAVAFHRKHEE